MARSNLSLTAGKGPLVLENPDQFQLAFGKHGSLKYASFFVLSSLVGTLAGMAIPSFPTKPFWLRLLCSLGLSLSVGLWVGTVALKRIQHFLRLESIEDMSSGLGCSEVELAAQIRGQDVQPRYIVNGRKLYDRKDLGDAALLLRSSQPNLIEQSLLKPLEASANVPENLVKPV
jgi:hypothetical protein